MPVVLLGQIGKLAERVLELAHHRRVRAQRRCLTIGGEAVELRVSAGARSARTDRIGRPLGDLDVGVTLAVGAADSNLDDLEGVESEEAEVVGAVCDQALEDRERDRELSRPRLAGLLVRLAPGLGDERVGDLGKLVRSMGAVLRSSA